MDNHYDTLTKMVKYYENIPVVNVEFLYVIADELEYVINLNF